MFDSACCRFHETTTTSTLIGGNDVVVHEAFGSVSVQRPPAAPPLDELAFLDWLEAVLRRHATQLLRAKGLLFFRDTPGEATALQCVGTHAELERLPADQMLPALLESRRSRLVFIGCTEGLERELRDGFCAL